MQSLALVRHGEATRGLFLIAIATTVSASCSRRDAATEPAVANSSRPAPRETRAIEPSKDVSELVRHLETEARSRPPSGITAEQVFDALERAGMSITARKQYLGASMQASYCAGGSMEGIALSVCEYPSMAAAELGKRFMDERFGKLTPHASREVHGNAVLTIGDKRGDVTSRAVAVFKGL